MTDLILPNGLTRKSIGEPAYRAVESTPAEDGARVLTYLASDETPDRMGDVIKVNGWNLTTYKRNPVVLWGHDTSNVPPIGRAVNVRRNVKTDGTPGLFASVEFAPPEAHEFADTVYQLSSRGYLNAVSVGFMPVDARDATDQEKAALGMPAYGVIYDRADLLEISVVSVPANPSALISGAKSLVDAGLVATRTMDRFMKTVPMTEEEMSARLKSKIRGFVDLAANTKSADPEPEPVVAEDGPADAETKDAEVVAEAPVEVVPEVKHIANVEETEETYVITFAKAGVVHAGSDDYEHSEEDRAPRKDEDEDEYRGFAGALTHLIDAQAEQARALSTLVDSVSDLTKRIHDYGGNGTGSMKLPDGAQPVPQSEPAEQEVDLRSVTQDFLTRLKGISDAEH